MRQGFKPLADWQRNETSVIGSKHQRLTAFTLADRAAQNFCQSVDSNSNKYNQQ
jgi:hypothetical protein